MLSLVGGAADSHHPPQYTHTHTHIHLEPGLDYTIINNPSCFLSESLPRCCVNITVLQDSIRESTERFTVELQLNSTNPDVVLGVSMARVNLADSNSEYLVVNKQLCGTVIISCPQLSPYPWSSLPTLWLRLTTQWRFVWSLMVS